MSAAGYLVIGDSLPFSARNAVSGRTGDPLTGATAVWSLLDAETRSEIASGSMTSFDDTATYGAGVVYFEAVVAPADTEDLSPHAEYLLKTTITHSGNDTSKAVRLVALLDPPPR